MQSVRNAIKRQRWAATTLRALIVIGFVLGLTFASSGMTYATTIKVWYYVNGASGKCLDIFSPAGAGSGLTQFTCSSAVYKYFAEDDQTYYPYIRLSPAQNPNLCVQVYNASYSNDAAVTLGTCTANNQNQQWLWVPNGLQNHNSYKCMVTFNDSNNATVGQFTCDQTNARQLWTPIADYLNVN